MQFIRNSHAWLQHSESIDLKFKKKEDLWIQIQLKNSETCPALYYNLYRNSNS